MKKKLKAGLYDPYLDVLGGGEKYILSILRVLAEENFEIKVFWDQDLTSEIKQRFNLAIEKIKFQRNIFKSKKFFLSKYFILKNYDIFLYVTNGSYFFSGAKKNFFYGMVPDKKLYQMNFLNRIKLLNWQCLTHSFFNQKILKKIGIQSILLYPYISSDFLKKTKGKKKERIILSVGRFFPQLHSKQQKKIIEIFKKIKQSSIIPSDYKLVLAGALKKEDTLYYKKLEELIKNSSDIVLKPNISFKELINLYQKASFFWHLTGYDIDENQNPEKVEHLGIAPLEAMASGCLTFCYNAGGPKEYIVDGENGFLFDNENQLVKKIKYLLVNKSLQSKIQNNAYETVKNKFSYEVFKRKVKEIIL